MSSEACIAVAVSETIGGMKHDKSLVAVAQRTSYHCILRHPVLPLKTEKRP